jgi:hypothetical protein
MEGHHIIMHKAKHVLYSIFLKTEYCEGGIILYSSKFKCKAL